VVFDDGGDHDVVGLEAESVGEVVDRFGGVAADDGNVVAPVSAGETKRCRPGVFVDGGGQLRFTAGTTVHARIPRHELADPFEHGRQGGGGGGGVERQVAAFVSVEAGHGEVIADERGETCGDHVKMIWPPAARV
jgi:hypothetical protein